MNEDIAIKVKNISKKFKTTGKDGKNRTHQFFAINNVSFSVKKGEMVGIIGMNGSGKTTLLRTISGIYIPDKGEIFTYGRIAPLLQIGVGFYNEITAKENIFLYGLLLGIKKDHIKKKIKTIIEFAELDEFQNMKLKHYSSGMKARLAFSTALQVDPDILLVDEILSVGDISFRKKSFDAFLSFKRQNKTILLTSHNLATVSELCDRVIWINKGKLEAVGNPSDVIKQYKENANS